MQKIKVMLVREKTNNDEEKSVTKPEDVFKMMRQQAAGLDREYFWRIDLNARNIVIGCETVSIGTLNASLCHPRELFKGAILNNAASVILVHNHPSDSAAPSEDDIKLTKRLIEAGSILGIEVLDHLVITSNEFTSMCSKNKSMFNSYRYEKQSGIQEEGLKTK